MKKTLLLLQFSFFFLFGYNQELPDSIQTTGDSIHYLTKLDTVFMEIGTYQEKVFNHYIAPKQTLYSLSKFYGLSLEELYFYNPQLKEMEIAVGQAVKIPIPTKSIIRYKIEGFDDTKHIPICYKIKKGDTMYKISKRTFQMPIDTIMVRNGLMSFDLSIDQIILVGWMSIEGIPEENRRYRGHPVWKRNDTLRKKYINNRDVKKEYVERGVAYWQKQSQKGSELYALHRKAPINSIIAITNPMKKRTVYAKVIGRMPESVYSENIIVVLSSTAANMLGAKDGKFYVQTRYTK